MSKHGLTIAGSGLARLTQQHLIREGGFVKISMVFPTIQDPKAEVLFVHCVDPHFEEAWNGLPRAMSLEPGESASIRIAGGPIPLAYPEECPSRAKQAVQQLLFARDKFPKLKKGIFVVHEKCAYYCTIPKHRSGREDLALAGSLAQSLFPDWEIELLYAMLINQGKEIQFEDIPPSEKIIQPQERWFKHHKPAHAHT